MPGSQKDDAVFEPVFSGSEDFHESAFTVLLEWASGSELRKRFGGFEFSPPIEQFHYRIRATFVLVHV